MKRRVRFLVVLVLVGLMFEAFSAGQPARAGGIDLLSFPVVPSMTGAVGAHARNLAYLGKQRGNKMHLFSKVGDSITAWGYSLTPIGAGGLRLYDFQGLQKTAIYFVQDGNSFTAFSFAAHDAWTSADLLSPGSAPHGPCLANEGPLDCELRIKKPAIALIMIGTNDVAQGNVAAFKANLDQIVTHTERQAVIPVVSTIIYRRDKPEYEGRVNAYNEAIVEVALAHNVPLWNFWLATSGLPAQGVSIDGVHPSLPGDRNTAIFDHDHLQAGFTMRNLTALQVLESLIAVLN